MRLHYVSLGIALILALACGSSDVPDGDDVTDTPEVTNTPEVTDTPESPIALKPLHTLFTTFLEEGCDAEAIDSPVVTRVLRNLPFAQAGRRFTSADLDTLFRADGDWYTPTADDVEIAPADAACVATLRAREDTIRSIHCFEDEAQAVLTRDPEVFAWHAATDLDGLIGHEASSQDHANTFQACSPPTGSFPDDQDVFLANWTVEIDSPTDARAAAEMLPSEKRFMGASPEEVLAENMAITAPLFAKGKAVRCLVVVQLVEDHMGEDVFEGLFTQGCCGTGPIMGSDWKCTEASMP